MLTFVIYFIRLFASGCRVLDGSLFFSWMRGRNLVIALERFASMSVRMLDVLVWDEGEEINSQETLCILGFVFGTKPSVDAHVEHLVMKFGLYLRHLKRVQLTSSRNPTWLDFIKF